MTFHLLLLQGVTIHISRGGRGREEGRAGKLTSVSCLTSEWTLTCPCSGRWCCGPLSLSAQICFDFNPAYAIPKCRNACPWSCRTSVTSCFRAPPSSTSLLSLHPVHCCSANYAAHWQYTTKIIAVECVLKITIYFCIKYI